MTKTTPKKRTKSDQRGATSRAKANNYDPAVLVIFGIDEPAAPDHPLCDDDLRRLRRIDPALVRNMKHHGVILPIVTKTVGQGGGKAGKVVIVDGRRRALHLRAANDERRAEGLEPFLVRCVARSGAADDDDQLAAISANMFREDHGPIAIARKAQRLLNRNAAWPDLEVSFGMTRDSLENRLALLELSGAVQAAVEDGQIGMMAALEVRGFTHEQQELLVTAVLQEGGPKRGMVPRIRVLAVELGVRSSPTVDGDAGATDEDGYTVTDAEQAAHDALVAAAVGGDGSAVAELYGQESADYRARMSLQEFAESYRAEPQVDPDDDDGFEYVRTGAVLTPRPRLCAMGPENETDLKTSAEEWPTDVLDRAGQELRRDDWVEIREPGRGAPYQAQVVAAQWDDRGHTLTVARRGDGKRLLAHSRYALGTNELDGEKPPAADWPEGVQDRVGHPLRKGDYVHVEDKVQAFDAQVMAAAKTGRGYMLQLLNAAGETIEAHSRYAVLTSAPPTQPSAAQIAKAKAPRPEVLRRLLEHPQAKKLLTDEVVAALRWVLGSGPASRRMTAALAEAAKPSAQPATSKRRKTA